MKTIVIHPQPSNVIALAEATEKVFRENGFHIVLQDVKNKKNCWQLVNQAELNAPTAPRWYSFTSMTLLNITHSISKELESWAKNPHFKLLFFESTNELKTYLRENNILLDTPEPLR